MPRPLVAFHTLKFASDLLHFRREASILFVLFVLLPVPINRRGMDGNERDQTGLQVDELTAFFGNKNRLAQNGLGWRCSHRLHRAEFEPQPAPCQADAPQVRRRDGLADLPDLRAVLLLRRRWLFAVPHRKPSVWRSGIDHSLCRNEPRRAALEACASPA